MMKLLLWLLFLQFSWSNGASDWTWTYRKRFSGSELENLTGKAHVTFAKNNVANFRQLIFSWNAYRPEQGYFTFYIQSRDAKTKKWSVWYKMVEWGAAVQRSHFVKLSNYEPEYVYVRLEQPAGRLADSFRLRVEAHGKAQLANLRSLSVSLSDFSKFVIEPVGQFLDLPTVKIRGVPQYSQMTLNHPDHKTMCSPTAVSMQLSYISKQKIDPVSFAAKCYDHGLGAYGSWPFNVAHAFEKCPNYTFRLVRLSGFRDLYHYLKRKIPVVVSVRGYMQGAPQEYKNGHLLTVVGWDQASQSVICHDPAIPNNHEVRHLYKLAHFLRSWESSHRLAYVVE